jgi:hypothetical protein
LAQVVTAVQALRGAALTPTEFQPLPAPAPGQANNSGYLLKNYGRDDPGRIFTEGVPSSRNNQCVTKPRARPPGTRQEHAPPR